MPCWKRCPAACCAESGGEKMLMLRASGSTGHLLNCDGQDEQVTLKLQKNHQTQCQCRSSWDRKQSLLVDPIRAPTRDNASHTGAHTQVRTHTHTHRCAHTGAHTQVRTHTHTHTQVQGLEKGVSENEAPGPIGAYTTTHNDTITLMPNLIHRISFTKSRAQN